MPHITINVQTRFVGAVLLFLRSVITSLTVCCEKRNRFGGQQPGELHLCGKRLFFLIIKRVNMHMARMTHCKHVA